MTNHIYKQKQLRNLVKMDIPITIEMHKSMWLDEFYNYSIKDLCVGGRIFENPDILKTATQKIKEKISNGYYNTYGVHPSKWSKQYKTLSNYLYIGDLGGTMSIYHQEEEQPSQEIEISLKSRGSL